VPVRIGTETPLLCSEVEFQKFGVIHIRGHLAWIPDTPIAPDQIGDQRVVRMMLPAEAR
jgi:hypothetical protein